MTTKTIKQALIESLTEGETNFTYVKADGSTRQARGTLNPTLIPTGQNIEAVDNSGAMITYWDLDKEAFRNANSETVSM